MRETRDPAKAPSTAARPGQRLGGAAVSAGLAALLLAAAPVAGAPVAGSPGAAAGPSIPDQFVAAFTPEIVDLGQDSVESVKLGE